MAKKRLAGTVAAVAVKKVKVSFIPEVVATGDVERAVQGRLSFEHCTS